jgi:hypothetical protein
MTHDPTSCRFIFHGNSEANGVKSLVLRPDDSMAHTPSVPWHPIPWSRLPSLSESDCGEFSLYQAVRWPSNSYNRTSKQEDKSICIAFRS